MKTNSGPLLPPLKLRSSPSPSEPSTASSRKISPRVVTTERASSFPPTAAITVSPRPHRRLKVKTDVNESSSSSLLSSPSATSPSVNLPVLSSPRRAHPLLKPVQDRKQQPLVNRTKDEIIKCINENKMKQYDDKLIDTLAWIHSFSFGEQNDSFEEYGYLDDTAFNLDTKLYHRNFLLAIPEAKQELALHHQAGKILRARTVNLTCLQQSIGK